MILRHCPAWHMSLGQASGALRCYCCCSASAAQLHPGNDCLSELFCSLQQLWHSNAATNHAIVLVNATQCRLEARGYTCRSAICLCVKAASMTRAGRLSIQQQMQQICVIGTNRQNDLRHDQQHVHN